MLGSKTILPRKFQSPLRDMKLTQFRFREA